MLWVRNLLIEFGPILVFFVASEFVQFYQAVAVMLLATLAGVLVSLRKGDRLPLFAIFGTIALFIFGLATVITEDSNYYILSDTILDGLFALFLLGSLLFKKTLLQVLFENTFAITDKAWRILTVRWAFLFITLATINEFIRVNYPEDVWVNYKLSTVFIILFFGLYQFTLSKKERLPGVSNKLGLRIK
jgi:intracellular septation protein